MLNYFDLERNLGTKKNIISRLDEPSLTEKIKECQKHLQWLNHGGECYAFASTLIKPITFHLYLKKNPVKTRPNFRISFLINESGLDFPVEKNLIYSVASGPTATRKKLWWIPLEKSKFLIWRRNFDFTSSPSTEKIYNPRFDYLL